jgi:O-antigen/teichoic acid export membrane protein
VANPTPARTGVRGARTVFSDYATMLAARLGSVALSLFSVVLTTRILTTAGYGTLAFFNLLGLLIFTIASGWTSAAVSRYGREQLEGTGNMAAVTWARGMLMLPLIGAACVVVPVLKLTGSLPPEFGWDLTWLAVGYGIAWIASEHLVYLMEASGRMKRSALGLLGQQAIAVAGIAIVYFTGAARTPVVIAAISVASSLVLALVFGPMLWRRAIWPPSFDKVLLRRIALFSMPLIAFTVSQYVVKSIDLVMIRAFEGPSQTGLYAVAYQGYSVLQAVAVVAPQVLTPLFVSLSMANRESVVRRYLGRVVPQITFLAATIAGVGAPLVGLAVPVVFGAKFRGATEPLELLLVAVVLFFGANLLAPIVVLRERTKVVGALNVAAALVNVAGDLITLGPLHMGIDGPAIATCLSLVVVFVGYFVTSRNALGAVATLNPLLFAPLAVGLVATRTLASPGAELVGIVGALVCAALIQALFKPIAREDLELFESLDIPMGAKRHVLRALGAVAR